MLLWLMNLGFAGGDGGTTDVYELASQLNGVNFRSGINLRTYQRLQAFVGAALIGVASFAVGA